MHRNVRCILLQRDLPYHGGVAKSFLNFARYRDRKCIVMWVVSFVAPSTEMVEMLYEVGVKTFSLGDHGYIKPAKKLITAITKYGIDVVVCASFKSYLAAKMATVETK